MKKNIKEHILALFFALIVIFLLYIWVKNSREDIERNKRYTIGCFFRTSWSGGRTIQYKYYVNGEEHIGGAGYNMDYDLLLGRCFFVKFSSKNPGNDKLLINMPVPDTVGEAPPLGWDTIEFRKLFGEEK